MTAESFYSFGFATGYLRLCAKRGLILQCAMCTTLLLLEKEKGYSNIIAYYSLTEFSLLRYTVDRDC